MTQNSGGQPGSGWGPQGSGYGGFYAPPAGGAASPSGPSGGDGVRRDVSATEAIGFGWRVTFGDFSRSALPLVVAWLAYGAASMVVGMLLSVVSNLVAASLGFATQAQIGHVDSTPEGIVRAALARAPWGVIAVQQVLAWVIGAAVGAALLPGILKFSLRVVRGEQPEFAEVFGGIQYFMPAFLAGLLVQLISLGSVLLCVVPWFIVMPGISMYMFCVVDRGAGATESIRESWRLANGNKLNIFLFFLLGALFELGALIACCLPVLLVAAPVLTIGFAHAYAALSGQLPAEPQRA